MNTDLYESDFYTWTQRQAKLLREGRFELLDVSHLIEELESMGARERRELYHRLAILTAHLLKWIYQPDRRGNSWRTIAVQRLDLAELLAANPGLKPQLEEIFARAYPKARLLAAEETGLEETTFPPQPPFTAAQALAEDYWPS